MHCYFCDGHQSTKSIRSVLFHLFISACFLLGDFLENVQKDFVKARKVYQSNCVDYNHGKSCLKFGNYVFLGKGKSGVKGSATDALQYYTKGCELNDATSCLHAGLLHVSEQTANNVPTTERKIALVNDFCNFWHLVDQLNGVFNYFLFCVSFQGVQQLTKSCELDNANACFYLSGLHISGARNTSPAAAQPADSSTLSSSKTFQTNVNTVAPLNAVDYVAKDMEKAFKFAYKACELRNIYACANVSQMYMRGEGTEKNKEKAEHFKKLTMEMQDELQGNGPQIGFQQMQWITHISAIIEFSFYDSHIPVKNTSKSMNLCWIKKIKWLLHPALSNGKWTQHD